MIRMAENLQTFDEKNENDAKGIFVLYLKIMKRKANNGTKELILKVRKK